MGIRFDKIDGFVRDNVGSRYLVLLGEKKNDLIYNKIRYHIREKSRITYVISHNTAKIKVETSGSLPLEKALKVLKLIH